MKHPMKSPSQAEARRRLGSYRPRLEFLESRLQPGSVLTGILSGGLLGLSPTVLELGNRSWKSVESAGGEIAAEPQRQLAALDSVAGGADTDFAVAGLGPFREARSEAAAIATGSADLPGSTEGAALAEAWADNSPTWPAAISRHGSGQATILAQFARAARSTTPPEGGEASSGLAIGAPVSVADVPPAGNRAPDLKLAAAQPTAAEPVTGAKVTPAPFTVEEAHFQTSVHACKGGGQDGGDSGFATFRGTEGSSEARAIAVTPDGVSYTVGFTEIPGSSSSIGWITQVDSHNPQSCAVATLTPPDNVVPRLVLTGIGTHFEGLYLYVSGYNRADDSAFVVRINRRRLEVDAGIRLTSPNGPVVLNGLAMQYIPPCLPPCCQEIYVTGTAKNAAGHSGVLVAEFFQALTVGGGYRTLLDFGNADAEGHTLAMDRANNAYVGGTLEAQVGNVQGLYLRLNDGGAVLAWAFAWTNPFFGGFGAVNGITVNRNNNRIIMAGRLNNFAGRDGLRDRAHHDLLLAEVLPDSGDTIWMRRWIVDGGDVGGNGVAVDAADNPYVVGSVNGPPDSSGTVDLQMLVAKFSPEGDVITGQLVLGGHSAPTPDVGMGLALASRSADADLYVAGWTESPDFDPIINACQRVFAGTRDGLIARFRQPLPPRL